jgi:Domain of unknown function (DUF4381)
MNPGAPTSLELREVHLPGTAPFWPPAPGWWLIALVLLAIAAWGGVVAWRHYRVHRRRSRILAVLASLESGLAGNRVPETLAGVSALLRRVALMRFPRDRVAALTGNAWLDFLDASGGEGRFRNGPGRVLANGPYQRTLPGDMDAHGLIGVARDWIKKNTGPSQ